MYSQELAQGHHSLVAVDRYTDPIDRIVWKKTLRMENMRISRKVVCCVTGETGVRVLHSPSQ